MSSTFIPGSVLPHFEAVQDFMKSLPPEGAEEIGEFFKYYGDTVAAGKRDLAQAKRDGQEILEECRAANTRLFLNSLQELVARHAPSRVP